MKGDKWNRKDFAAHRNSKFTAPASQCPTIDPEWQNPEGVLISAILFGGKRQDITPLVYESYNWNHGVLMGASLSSEVASATGCYKVDVRNNPFAMSQFCGYNMGDYFSHWISIGGQLKNRPKIFNVNWFMKDEMDFSENIHVLKWIHERTYSDNNAKETAIGYVPRELNLDILSDVDRELWKKEIAGLKLYFSRFQRFPEELTHELNSLEDRLL